MVKKRVIIVSKRTTADKMNSLKSLSYLELSYGLSPPTPYMKTTLHTREKMSPLYRLSNLTRVKSVWNLRCTTTLLDAV